jgi:hypothetical protein
MLDSFFCVFLTMVQGSLDVVFYFRGIAIGDESAVGVGVPRD